MNIHKIDPYLHQYFLEEERKDSVTGDLIQANDEVVFCASCKSAFLKGSWEYMDRKHCGQTKTLKKVPVSAPLLLNVTSIKPHFITLTNSTLSYKRYLKLLSSFSPMEKKVEILLDPILQRGTQQYRSLLEKTKRRIEKDELATEKTIKQSEFVARNTKVESISPKSSSAMIIVLVLICLLTVAFSLEFKGFSVVIAVISIVALIILLIYKVLDLLIGKENTTSKRKIDIEKETLKRKIPLGNLENISEIKESITFGVFNQDLFLYFEEMQQVIFIKLSRINKIEIKYQADCYVFIKLEGNAFFIKNIEIPLIFSKNARITKFLIKLAEAKKGIANPLKIIVTNFPIDQTAKLSLDLSLYPDITFIW